MAKVTEQDRRRAIIQALAICRIEGFEPDAEYLALVERYVSGELSTDDIRRHLDEAELRVSSAT